MGNTVVSNPNKNSKPAEVGKEEWLKKRIIPLLTLLVVIAITVGLFLVARYYPERVEEFETYGYLGAFLISLVANATIILPMPGLLILIGLGTVCNPILVGLVGAVGGAIGELTGYTAGRSGRGLAGREKMYTRAEGWMRRRGFVTIFLFSLLPFLPLDLAGMVAGVLRYSLWKFLLACFLGKALLYVVMIQTGAWGWEAGLRFFG
ncbi:VTT domain-containing protein [Chloroflexota bacterium]